MRLLGAENIGGRVERYWLHVGDDGRDRITVETIQDAEPTIEIIQSMTEATRGKDLRFKASIPATIVDEICKVYAPKWGLKPHEVLSELVNSKSKRSKRVWRMLTEGRDYRKLQAKAWR